ncbi:DUF4169 family protein [Rhizobium sp. NRK18]|uniref:DUF4169 family protein n=1 Tax=Rhizobium sp. NRK18 TaxID=2964667 RepID=UPI0021C390D7|nr:DUF4169 family protein [Rhizobium sp. NRK18]MCQ2003795.1 DUF4169 family protein [Rhizobium sp. NRK18]
MTAEIVNLRMARKQKTRQEKEKTAEQNRISFGRTKAEKELTTARNMLERKRLDEGRRETDDGSKD